MFEGDEEDIQSQPWPLLSHMHGTAPANSD